MKMDDDYEIIMTMLTRHLTSWTYIASIVGAVIHNKADMNHDDQRTDQYCVVMFVRQTSNGNTVYNSNSSTTGNSTWLEAEWTDQTIWVTR